jgi:hypothetical protein
VDIEFINGPQLALGQSRFNIGTIKIMRALDFIILEDTEILDEVAMNPTRLKQEAAKTGAQAGMEFEMIVPNVKQEEGDGDPEADYDSDESSGSIQNIRNFFYDRNYNGVREVDSLVDELTESYHEWADERRSEQWDSEGKDYLREYIESEGEFDEDAALDEAYDQLGLTDEQKEEANKAGKISKRSETEGNEAWKHWKEAHDLAREKLDQFVEEEWDEQSRLYDNAREKWMDETDWPEESDWLESEGLYTMQDVESNYDITWPHWFYPDNGGELSVDDIGDEFSRMIGKPVNTSERYHGARREAGHYVVEPDGSLEPDDYDSAGLEFVSPPMPIDEMISDFNKVVAWAKKTGCYTNDSTGLHINVSVPDFSREKLDYVKLALLLGDEYILKEFDREGNTFCKSALKQVKDNIRDNPENAKKLLDGMKDGLSDIASKLVHSGSTAKYTSINTKDGYIEFRSPGGDWLDTDITKIENTLLRFVVALDAAVDPQKYRKEYLTKLYKLLEPSKDSTDTIQYFAKYAAGELPKAALRSFVKQAQIERKVKADNEVGKKYWYRVDKEGRGRSGASLEVVATSKEEALKKASDEWNIRLGALTAAAVYPVRKFEEPKDDKPKYEIFNLDTNRKVEDAEGITNDREALIRLNDYLEHGPHRFPARQARDLFGIRRVGDSEPILAEPIRATGGETQDYKLYRTADQSVVYTFQATSVEEAREKAQAWLLDQGIDRRGYGLSRMDQPAPAPDSTSSIQQQRAIPGTFTGAWKVMADGREVHRFSGIGNVQRDANRVAIQWLRDNGYDQGTDIEVLPIMS